MIRSERLKAITAAVAQPRVRNPLVVAGSVLAHGLVLSLLALNSFDPPVPARPYNPPIYLEIDPRPPGRPRRTVGRRRALGPCGPAPRPADPS